MKIIKILNYIFPLIIGALCSYMGSLQILLERYAHSEIGGTFILI